MEEGEIGRLGGFYGAKPHFHLVRGGTENEGSVAVLSDILF